ncbi:17646_t:CDS:1, partial [Gigaspora rosea]
FPEYKKRYLRDYLNSRQLFQYQFESENQLENNQSEVELIEIIEDPIRESSTSANKRKHDEILLETETNTDKRTKK